MLAGRRRITAGHTSRPRATLCAQALTASRRVAVRRYPTVSKINRTPSTDPAALSKYTARLQASCEKTGTVFREYDERERKWVFEVPGFT